MNFTKNEAKRIYAILFALREGQLTYPSKEWEMEHYEERLIETKGINQIVSKIREVLTPKEAKEIESRVLRRKYDAYSCTEVDDSVYDAIERAFSEKRRLEITYFSMDKAETIRRKIDVYYKSGKYVIAFCHLKNAVRKFRTSRILKAKLLNERYSIPENFNKKDYL